MRIYFILEAIIHLLEQWFPTLFIPIPFHKQLLLISPLLMTYVGWTGTLMAENDLVEVVCLFVCFVYFPQIVVYVISWKIEKKSVMRVHMHNSEASQSAGPRGSSQQSSHDADPKSVSQAGTASRPSQTHSYFVSPLDVLGGSSRRWPSDRQPVYGHMQ